MKKGTKLKTHLRNSILNYIYMIIGSIFLAFSITAILKPNNLIIGGITGMSLILEKVVNINYSYLYYAISVLILISAYIFIGKREARKIILFSLIFPIVLIFFEQLNFNFVKDDLFLASIYFGVIGGGGCGLVFKAGFSQGGTDTIAKIFHKRLFPFISMSQILLFIDIIVIILSIFVFNKSIALYAIFTEFVFIKSIDAVLFGLSTKNFKIEIISTKTSIISDYILNTVKRGLSVTEIKGAYTGLPKTKLITVCSTREVSLIKRFISETDCDAFITVVPVMTVWGEGLGFGNILDD